MRVGGSCRAAGRAKTPRCSALAVRVWQGRVERRAEELGSKRAWVGRKRGVALWGMACPNVLRKSSAVDSPGPLASWVARAGAPTTAQEPLPGPCASKGRPGAPHPAPGCVG
jgi:hypothetical protein